MPSFSKASSDRLESCHPDLQKVFEKVVENFDCSIIQGHRSEEEQNEYFRTKRSKVQYPNSKHNSKPSMAADVSPYPIDWKDEKRFYFFAGYVLGVAFSMGIKLRWGGDWDSDKDLNDQNFMDLVHFEVKK